MKMKFGIATTVAALAIGVLVGPAANAADSSTPTQDDLTAQQQQAISAWEAGVTGTTKDAKVKAVATVTAAAGGVKTMKLYRGSWVLWAEECIQFGYNGDGRTVGWSSGWQNSGWVIPNNVSELGQNRFYTTSTQHDWRGGFRVGAGVPTPWGNANVYSATSYAQSRVKNIGSVQWWLN